MQSQVSKVTQVNHTSFMYFPLGARVKIFEKATVVVTVKFVINLNVFARDHPNLFMIAVLLLLSSLHNSLLYKYFERILKQKYP